MRIGYGAEEYGRTLDNWDAVCELSTSAPAVAADCISPVDVAQKQPVTKANEVLLQDVVVQEPAAAEVSPEPQTPVLEQVVGRHEAAQREQEATKFTMTKLRSSVESSWATAMLGWSPCTAAMVVPVRLLWHLLQPTGIWFALFEHRNAVLHVVFVLISLRQGLHIMCVFACMCVNPAFLLIDLGASTLEKPRIAMHHGGLYGYDHGYPFLAMYAIRPEVFLAYALLDSGGLGNLEGVFYIGNHTFHIGDSVLIGHAVLDLCGLAALSATIGAGNIAPVLAVGYGAPTLSAIWTAVAIAMKERVARLMACVLLSTFVVPLALNTGWIGDDGASGSNGEVMDRVWPWVPSDVPTWLVNACYFVGIASCGFCGCAVFQVYCGHALGGHSGGNGYNTVPVTDRCVMAFFWCGVGTCCCVFAVIVLLLAAWVS